MGLLNFFNKPVAPTLVRLPTGSFTIDKDGRVVTSTLPQGFPPDQVKMLGQTILAAFVSAQKADQKLTEIVVDFAALRLTARELRGGAIVFLAPRTLANNR